MNSKLRIVLDTNVFLVSLLPHHNYGQADYLVTHDKHFNILKGIPFPKVEVIRLDELKKLLDS